MTKIPVLFRLMDERNITAKQLSLDTGISTGNISDWKKGRSKPSMEKLAILSDYFNVTTDYLLGIDNGTDVGDGMRMSLLDSELTAIVSEIKNKRELREVVELLAYQRPETLARVKRFLDAFLEENK